MVFGTRVFNLGEAIDQLLPFMSKKTIINIIRRLSKLGLIKHVGNLEYRVVNPDEVLRRITLTYMASRVERRYKNKVKVVNIGDVHIEVNILDSKLRNIISKSTLIRSC